VAEVTDARNSEAFKVNQEAKAAVVAAGGKIRQLTAEQKAEWVAAMKPVWAQFEGDVGAENIAAAQAFNAEVSK
jgi:C4-dicarboxylate-binding protein DctP